MNRWRRLAAAGVMGINRRNADYTLAHNPRRLYPLVDDKLRTKNLAEKADIAIPALYGVVEAERQLRGLPQRLAAHAEFVVKPARGSGGAGIVVVDSRVRQNYVTASGAMLRPDELLYHVANILAGAYSLGGQPDKALIEYRVQPDPVFAAISHLGVPDIRIIVFLGVPVMAMARLPTVESEGKANLHRGAIGAGIDMATGATLAGVWRDRIVTRHPDTGNRLAGVQVPGWPRLLLLAARAGELCGLGYVGVDFVLDRSLGPLMLELNARPGLNIQIANRAGLLKRLRRVETDRVPADAPARVAYARRRFGTR